MSPGSIRQFLLRVICQASDGHSCYDVVCDYRDYGKFYLSRSLETAKDEVLHRVERRNMVNCYALDLVEMFL